MTCVSSGFRYSLLFLVLFVAGQSLAKPGNNANSTPVSSTAIKRCNNVYNSFYAGPNKKIETFLQEMKTQLTHVEDDINILKGNKTSEKESNKTVAAILQKMMKQLNQVQDDISILKGNTTLLNEQNKNIEALLLEMNKQLSEVKDVLKKNKTKSKIRKDCAELYKSGQRTSGVYTIDPDGSGAFDVFCDQTTAGGRWTVFQKRLDGSVDFYRGWADYKNGFGNLNGEFWLGLDKIHRLTNTKNRLRVELEDTAGKTAYAEYDMFAVTSERTKYKLSLGTYSGTAGDSLSIHRGSPFSTKDHDNDKWGSNRAVRYKGAWWYDHCHHSNLNGLYHHGKHSGFHGVNWGTWKGYSYSVKRAEMKIRPVMF
ncbi:microfibril-associated glycoprotein 4-like [Orbicella faveolata]|uniref:microfibril-associated glycoprotein 4-like n=1 Tax=Orbicella faveolata TaxID=48498 RepID=UPI0009E4D9E7|nr:microfibril-associated glycoprotein 4-like [Orbicella faveolata]